MENSNNSYFLHSGDHPSLALISHLLNGSNYNTWNHAMWMALNAKNKLGFVYGLISQSTVGMWSLCNSMVTSWLLNVVSKDIADSLLDIDTTQTVWSYLHDRFCQSNAPRIF